MRLLVLGGTAWLGREIVARAGAAGHQVVCAARGSSGRFPSGVRSIVLDRDDPEALTGLAEETWDAVLDLGTQPGHVRRAARALAAAAEHYVQVSTVSVYADAGRLGQDESAPVLPAWGDDLAPGERYGEGKVACERAVTETFGEAATIARAGLIGGPGDGTGRSGYWPARFAAPSGPEGAVLVPDAPDQPTAIIDVRDLAAWLVRCAEDRIGGVYDACGPILPFAEHLAAARSVAGHRGALCAAAPAWLTEHDVQPWFGPRSLPIWLPAEDWGLMAHPAVAAYAAGLTARPLEDTLADVLRWSRTTTVEPRSGLEPHDEAELLGLLAT